VYVQDDLVLSRQLVGIAGPSTWTDNDGRDNDAFLLEVQRTLDFFESQIARRPVQKLFLAPLSEFDQATQQLLQQNLNVRVEHLPLPLSDASAPVHGSAACLALAAALRAEHATH
jgi:MSHA biogenesis protein MshI